MVIFLNVIFIFMKRCGFTLIELLIYIGMAAVLLSIVGVIGINILMSKARLMATDEVASNGRYALERIGDLVSSANGVTAPALGLSASTLTLTMATSSLSPTVVSLSGGKVYVQQGVGANLAITSANVTATSLTFNNLSTAGDPPVIRISLNLKYNNPSNRPEYNVSEAFVTTANIRTQ